MAGKVSNLPLPEMKTTTDTTFQHRLPCSHSYCAFSSLLEVLPSLHRSRHRLLHPRLLLHARNLAQDTGADGSHVCVSSVFVFTLLD